LERRFQEGCAPISLYPFRPTGAIGKKKTATTLTFYLNPTDDQNHNQSGGQMHWSNDVYDSLDRIRRATRRFSSSSDSFTFSLTRELCELRQIGLVPLTLRLRRVVSARIKRMTTKNPAERLPSATPKSIAPNRGNRILAAGWCEATRLPEQRADASLVTTDQKNRELACHRFASALSQLKIIVELKPVRRTSSRFIPHIFFDPHELVSWVNASSLPTSASCQTSWQGSNT